MSITNDAYDRKLGQKKFLKSAISHKMNAKCMHKLSKNLARQENTAQNRILLYFCFIRHDLL